MARRRILCFIAASTTALTLVASLTVAYQRHEPAYQGRRLSQWIRSLDSTSTLPMPPALVFRKLRPIRNSAGDLEAAEAIRHIGTNAVPFLLDWMGQEGQVRGTKLQEVTDSILTRTFGVDLIHERAFRPMRAATALAALGPAAKDAIPVLTTLLCNPSNTVAVGRAAWILAHLGTEGQQAINSALRDPKFPQRASVLRAQRNLRPDTAPPLQAILECLRATDATVALEAAFLLGSLDLRPDLCVPALTDSLGDSRAGVRVAAAAGLRFFNSDAKPAVPALLKALKDTDPGVRVTATNALRSIAPEALMNAPLHHQIQRLLEGGDPPDRK